MTHPDEHPDYISRPFGTPPSNPWAQPPVFGKPGSGKNQHSGAATTLGSIKDRTAEDARREPKQSHPHLPHRTE